MKNQKPQVKRIQVSQIKRKQRRKELFFSRVRVIFRLFLIFLIFFGVFKLITSRQWFLSDDAFKTPNNKYLKIYGNEITPKYQILSAMRRVEVKKVPLYMLDTKPFVEEILKLEPVKNVYITRFWLPARLEVIIEEKTPFLIIAPSEKNPPIAFFTTSGQLIGREYMPIDPKFKTIKILTYGTRGDDYRKWDIKKLKSIGLLAQTIEAYSNEKLNYIDMRNPHDIYAKIPSALLRIGEYNETTLKRVESVQAILPKVKTLNKKVKYIDLRWEEAYYIKIEESS